MNMRRRAADGVAAILVIGALVLAMPAAYAAKGGAGRISGGSSSLSVVMVTDANADGPSYHDTVTFKLSTSATRPYVQLNCTQGGTLVLAGSVGFFADYPWSQDFVLASNAWTGGAADCKATLYTTKDGSHINTLASLSFHVNA
jgi:hypothetical protein